jgi:hypothetical protein
LVIGELLELLDILDVSEKNILYALKSDFNDFEDAIQYSVALNESLNFILTRNKNDYKSAAIPVFEPATFVKLKESELQNI